MFASRLQGACLRNTPIADVIVLAIHSTFINISLHLSGVGSTGTVAYKLKILLSHSAHSRLFEITPISRAHVSFD